LSVLQFKYTSTLNIVLNLQFVVILDIKDIEFPLTIVVIPLTVAILIYCAWAVRNESMIGMAVVQTFFVAGVAYYLFKLVRIYQPSQAYKYASLYKPLTIFGIYFGRMY
jgi:hypothetical protein